MDTEKKTGERIGITLALLACVGFSAFLIWLQQSQENDRQQLTQQVQDSGQREEQTEGSTGGKQYLLYTGWHGAGSGERNSL